MSIKTTPIITRDLAIQVIMLRLNNLTDRQLANILEEAVNNEFYNFGIVTEVELAENKEETYPMPSIENLSSIPESSEY